MYAHLRGRICDVEESLVVIDVNGIGFNVYMSAGDVMSLEQGAETTVYTYTSVREDAMQLYGFLEKSELALFRKLITVNGVGMKNALAIMSTLDADSLVFAIASGDSAAISRAPGIGKKTADRVILELKDKVDPGVTVSHDISGGEAVEVRGTAASEAVEALISLGYSRSESVRAVGMVKADEGTDTGEILREALKNL